MSSRVSAGQPRNVLHRQVQHGMFGHGGMAVAQHPSLVKVGGFFLADFLSDLVEGLRPTGGHSESHSDLLLGQIVGVEGIHPAVIGGLFFFTFRHLGPPNEGGAEGTTLRLSNILSCGVSH